MKKGKGFNTPFAALKGLEIRDKKTPVPLEKQGGPPQRERGAQDLFARAMEGVSPMANDLVTPEPSHTHAHRGSSRGQSLRRQDQEVLEHLYDLVQGRGAFDITSTGEYIEGHALPIDPQLMTKLKAGEFAVQHHLDLHGLSRDEARGVLSAFVQNAHALSDRSLLVIHGRGLKSPQEPVLKNSVIGWLSTGALSHLVLAFCSARPCDGGTGALYVLLRRRPRKARWKRP